MSSVGKGNQKDCTSKPAEVFATLNPEPCRGIGFRV